MDVAWGNGNQEGSNSKTQVEAGRRAGTGKAAGRRHENRLSGKGKWKM